jgi:rhodanese-related sulfurtransferase
VSAESYAGDLSVQEAWKLLADDDSAVLVDVRTRPEWLFVGIPDLSGLGREPVFCEWQSFPTMQINSEFAAQLRATGVGEDSPILFLCRSGQRSKSAAIMMTGQGFARCYNVAGGFEGPKDNDRHRGTVGGWKAAGLPWVQE